GGTILATSPRTSGASFSPRPIHLASRECPDPRRTARTRRPLAHRLAASACHALASYPLSRDSYLGLDRRTRVRVEHVFAMIACIVIPGFELRAALRERPRLQVEPAALAPEPGSEALLGPVTAAAETAGVRPGMRLGEALAMCPSLQLVDPDPAAAEEAWEQIVRRLEDAGIAVDPAAPGCAYFETRGVERLYGGLEPALRRVLKAVGPGWDARIGAARRRFAALAAANVARSGQVLIVSDEHTREFLSPLPLTLLPLAAGQREELQELGLTKFGLLAGLSAGSRAA